MDIRDVDIEKYWPAVVRKAAEFQQIAIAENPEFNQLFECIMRVLGEGFIHDATEYGVARWESMLGLVPNLTDTLEDRKIRILTYLTLRRPYTWRVLQQMITSFVGEGNFEMSYINDFCRLEVRIVTEDENVLNTIRSFLSNVLPQNVIIDVDYGVEFKFRQLVAYYKANGSDGQAFTMFGGRLVVDNRTSVTNDTTNQAQYIIIASATKLAHKFWNNKVISEIKGWYAPNVTDGEGGFRYCNSLTRLPASMTLSSLTNGYRMFVTTNLSALPEGMLLDDLTNGHAMFYACKSLTTLPEGMTLSNLEEGDQMFYQCPVSALPKGMLLDKLKSGIYMFGECAFESLPEGMTLSSLQDGTRMFRATPLRHVPNTLNLASLTNGLYMFFGSDNLTEESIQNILDALPDRTDMETAPNIGLPYTAQYMNIDVRGALAKGWIVTFGTTVVQTLSLDQPTLHYLIDLQGDDYIREDGTLCGLVECQSYFVPEGRIVESVEATSEAEAAQLLNLTINQNKDR